MSPLAHTLVHTQVLQQLYDGDVMSEEALLAWAEEKEHADESDKVYLKKVRTRGGAVGVLSDQAAVACA